MGNSPSRENSPRGTRFRAAIAAVNSAPEEMACTTAWASTRPYPGLLRTLGTASARIIAGSGYIAFCGRGTRLLQFSERFRPISGQVAIQSIKNRHIATIRSVQLQGINVGASVRRGREATCACLIGIGHRRIAQNARPGIRTYVLPNKPSNRGLDHGQ